MVKCYYYYYYELTHSFANHSNMLICSSKSIYTNQFKMVVLLNMETMIDLYILLLLINY